MSCKVSPIVSGLAFVMLAVGVCGCGPQQFDTTGQVKYNKEVLAKPDGQIVFMAPDGSQVSAPIGLDGSYTAKVTAGPNRVAVYYRNPAFKKPSRPKGPDPKPPTPSPAFLTPEKYADVATSALSVEVKEGTVFNVEMTGPPIR
jgi:hypothetical protein